MPAAVAAAARFVLAVPGVLFGGLYSGGAVHLQGYACADGVRVPNQYLHCCTTTVLCMSWHAGGFVHG